MYTQTLVRNDIDAFWILTHAILPCTDPVLEGGTGEQQHSERRGTQRGTSPDAGEAALKHKSETLRRGYRVLSDYVSI